MTTCLDPPFDDPAWYRALTLVERIELRRRTPGAPVSAERSAARLARWRAQKPFGDPGVLDKRLATDGATREELAAVLGTDDRTLATLAGEVPAWLKELVRAYGERCPAGPEWPPEDAEPHERALLALARPLALRAIARLREAAGALAAGDSEPPFEPAKAAELLIRPLTRRLYGMIVKTLVLELNVARVRGALEGETPQKRFESFARRLDRGAEAAALLTEYPVLGRALVETLERWHDRGLDLLRHLAEDRRDLEQAFAGGAPLGRLSRLRGEAGDLHRGGRSVHLLAFDSGVELVYKPRSLAVDRHFQELLEWLNERGDHPPFRTLTLLDRGDHGWVELVRTAPCDSADAVERFYRRQGGYLALLYGLEANDFHFENLIASGEHPVPIDLESLFQQHVQIFDRSSALGMASDAVAYSVIRTGLLPQLGQRKVRQDGIDVSALGAEPGQVANTRRAAPDEPGTDRMRLVPKEGRFPGGQNLPVLEDRPQRAREWLPAIEAGFESVYHTLVRHREELLAPGGPIAAFAHDEARLLLRDTAQYHLLIVDSFHPDLLRDALDRERHFDRLWIGIENRPETPDVAPAEREEAAALDIPIFVTRPGEADLLSGRGRRLEGYFAETGLELVARRVAAMDERDLERQRWMIGATLAALESGQAAPEPGTFLLAGRPAPEPERLLRAARRAADRLEELAMVGADGAASWVGIVAADEDDFAPTPLGIDLYSGLSGVALFLAQCGRLADEPRYEALARAAWRSTEERLSEVLDQLDRPGVFTGLGGVLYAAGHLHRLWGGEDLLEWADRLIVRLEVLLEDDRSFDLIAGAAGCLLVLLGLARAGHPRALELAEWCGEHLLRHAQELDGSLVWVPEDRRERPLAGLSHGAAGFSWALLELAAETGDPRYRDAARRAIAYERTLFVPERSNWRDLRSFHGADGGFTVAWCNGAAGIGLTRLVALEHLDGPGEREALLEEIRHALVATLRDGFGPSQCLCHGSLGNLELLTEAARQLGDDRWLEPAGQMAAAICDEALAGRFCCGVPGGFETPGLMDGLAGIGFGLLRLADPERVPSVLLLEPPRPAAAAAATMPALMAATGGP